MYIFLLLLTTQLICLTQDMYSFILFMYLEENKEKYESPIWSILYQVKYHIKDFLINYPVLVSMILSILLIIFMFGEDKYNKPGSM